MSNEFLATSAQAAQTAKAVLADMSADRMNYGKTPLDELPLAMAYVPMQRFRKLYEPDVGLDRGTIFAELDMPFIGKRAV